MADDPPPRRPRHYEKVEELVVRTASDVSPAAMDARASVEPITERLLASRPRSPRLVGSAEGGIERLLLTIPAYAVESPVLAGAYRGLLERLSPHTGLVVLTHAAVRDEVLRWLDACDRREGTQVMTADDHLHFSVWAEDGYVAVTDGAETYLVEPFSFPRYADSLIADLLSNATDMRHTQAPLYFQGGNLLIGDDFFLIGADYPANSLDYVRRVLLPGPGETPTELVRRLYQEYLDTGRDLLYVGSTVPVPEETTRRFQLDGEDWMEVLHAGNAPGTAQPLFHIDMFISPAGRGSDGRYRLLVGDPRSAADLLGTPLRSHAMAEVFDNVARNLAGRGFDVIRNPLPLVYVDDEVARRRSWYFATANNALVERPDAMQPRVFLPTYAHGAWASLEATDEANRDVWARLGYEVVPLGDFHPFAENLGAVHCITKYLARSVEAVVPPAGPDVTGFLASLAELERAAPADQRPAWQDVNRALGEADPSIVEHLIGAARASGSR